MAVVAYASGPRKGNRIVVADAREGEYLATGFISDASLQELKKQASDEITHSLENLKQRKKAEIESAYQNLLITSVTIDENPTQTDIAIGAGIMGGYDPEGLDFLAEINEERKDVLLAQLDKAQTVEDVENVKVKWIV